MPKTATTPRPGLRETLDHDPARVRRRRVEHGLTQAQLAARAHISAAHMSLIESGDRNPSPKALRRLAEALDCETAELMPDLQAAV